MALAEQLNDAPFTLEPQTPTIGATISGIDLRAPLTAETTAAIRAAVLEWKVVFFHDQNLNDEEHLAFARNFGDLEIHPLTPINQANPEILNIVHDENKTASENLWHSDVTWRPEPSMGSILRAIEIPSVGGDTLWADMEAAYDGLPQEVKDAATGLDAEHSFLNAFGFLIPEEDHAEIRVKHPEVTHPVIRTHPETGRRCIYVNGVFATHIKGEDQEKLEFLRQLLVMQASKPEYQVRLKWRPGTVAFWDNRSTQHYANADYAPARRHMARVTICGNRPFFDAKA